MIFEVLQQVLGEFFVDVQARNVSFYAGDLFESSHFKLSDVFLKTALINALQLPFELSAGYIGNVKIEGLVGAVAGWPLEVSVSDVCLVLRPHKVQWDNELLIRYAKEFVVAMLQCLGAPSATKKGKGSLFSPAKWIASRVQAVGAEMIVQVERIHIRVESPRTDCDNLVAYGLNIPLIRFAPRELEEQILYRRQQPGVIYPKAVDGVMSKLLTVENVSFYADLDADAYWTSPAKTEASTDTTEQPVASALLASPEVNTSSRQFTHEDALKRFKECVLKSFARDKRRELVHVRVVWIKLDLVPGEQNTGESGSVPKPVLAAVDIATEEIELNIDFDQIAVILGELEHVVDYFKRFRTWKWRPSCIDREHHTPPSVEVAVAALFPVPPNCEENCAATAFSVEKQRKSRQWFRAMWRYAFRCILDQQRLSIKESPEERDPTQYIDPRYWWRYNEFDDKELQEIRRKRYIHLYARSLSPAAMEIALYGRGKALLGFQDKQNGGIAKAGKGRPSPPSPRRRPLPEFDPLTQEEQWELSDFVATMGVYEQRVCRALAETELRADFTAAPPSPTRRVSAAMEFSIAPTDSGSDYSSRHSRSVSVDAVQSPPKSQSAPLSSEFATAGERRHFTRGLTIDPAELSVRPASPPFSRPHAASTSDLPSPTKRENPLDLEPLRAWIYKQRKLGLLTTSWFEKQFFPAWILNPAKVIPLLNLQIGPVTLRLSEGNLDQAHKTKRGIGIEVGFESCSGAMLLTRTPFLRILVEIRVGLFHVTLVRQQNLHDKTSGVDWENGISEYKWISSDYIRLPEDGFFYIGLKYSAQEVGAKPTGRVQFVGNLEEELGLKGRMCIGPIKIDCNEAAMRLAMGQTVADELRASTAMDVSTSTHFSVLQDAYHSFVNLVAHLPKRKGARKGYAKDSSPRATKRSSTANADPQDKFPREDQQKLEKSAKRTRMLHALLLRSSMFEVEVGTLELNLSAYTSHIEKALRTQVPKNVEAPKSSETREDVKVMLPTTMYRLQNRPSMNECIVDVAGARVVYRSTKQGRAAVIRHLAQLFKL
ncbi:hypothetical protein PR002_g2656 [Phytophthora rubi]|uniref:Vacuolar protein sorting-associated protein 13 second N-terminal domain-containing protein n=1 Tax=Phytophthora rubi TaxID=129364 RepID=A0A6A3NJS6_9STRA|nr:hypothetical protein PR002_g2656 [Phytophthora rubi]